MKKKSINSHKYIPKSILERFAIKDEKNNHWINYYDYNDKCIKKERTSSFNTQEGYFTMDNERKLSLFSEGMIGNVIAKLEKQYKEENINFYLSVKDINIIKTYASYQLMRDESILDFTRRTLSNQEIKHVFSNKKIMEIMGLRALFKNITNRELSNNFISSEKSYNTFKQSFDNLALIVRFNYSKVNYVLTSSSTALYPYSKGYFIMNMTLTPKISIMFCSRENFKKAMNTTEEFMIQRCDRDDEIYTYNQKAYETAKNNKPNLLIGYKEELQNILIDE